MLPHALNLQDQEGLAQREDGTLDVHSIWYTIQGEGPFTGYPAIFIRLAGCNLKCPECDTNYTSTRKLMTPQEVHDRVTNLTIRKKGTRKVSDLITVVTGQLIPQLVVVTGGEPFRQNFYPAARLLLAAGYMVQVETNGTLPPPENELLTGLIVVCSPKAPKVHPKLINVIGSLKYVMRHDQVDPEDGLPTVALGGERPARPWGPFADRDATGAQVILNPEDSGDEETNKLNMEACVKSCMKYGYKLGIQLHKLAGVP